MNCVALFVWFQTRSLLVSVSMSMMMMMRSSSNKKIERERKSEWKTIYLWGFEINSTKEMLSTTISKIGWWFEIFQFCWSRTNAVVKLDNNKNARATIVWECTTRVWGISLIRTRSKALAVRLPYLLVNKELKELGIFQIVSLVLFDHGVVLL